MRVRVLFFGQLKDIVGRAEDVAELSEGARVADLYARYGNRFPRLAAFRDSVVPSLNQEFAEWQAPLAADDEVGFLPPVSGGQSTGEKASAVAEDLVRLVRERIATDEIVAGMKAPADGAVVAFEGIVRDNSKGRRTLHLEYEAYQPMALAQMRRIAAEMRASFDIHRSALVHRLGRLDIGETSVLIVVASAHRRAAFDACRYGIDTLKSSVPIWKKEFFADGAVWAEGHAPSQKDFPPSGASKA